MSALGHKRTLKRLRPMSAIPPKADIAERDQDVRFVPMSDRLHCGKTANLFADHQQRARSSALPTGFSEAVEHVGVVFWPKPGRAFADLKVERGRRDRDGLL